MKSILKVLVIVILVVSVNGNIFAAKQAYTTNQFKEDTSVLNEISWKIFSHEYMSQYCDCLKSSCFDSVYYHSNEGLFLYLYELLYGDSKEWLTKPIVHDQHSQVYYDTVEERELRIKRLLDDKYITQDEIKQYPITKEMIANILYRIYGEEIPFKNSVDYTDTANAAVEWGGEVGLPYFNYRSGFCIYPEEKIYVAEYSTIMAYVYLCFPKKGTNEYNTTEGYFEDYEGEIVHKIRETIKKPRLGYWKRDVINNSELKELVLRYQSKKRETDLIEIHKQLKEQYNMFNYQDDIGYVRYMFTLYQ